MTALTVLKKLTDAFFNLRIRSKMLITLMFLMLLPVLLIGFFSYEQSEKIIKQKSREYNTDILNEISRNIETALNEFNRIYYAIFTSADVQYLLNQERAGFPSARDALEARRKVENHLLEAILDNRQLEAVYLFSSQGNRYSSLSAGPPYMLTESDKMRIEAAKGKPAWLDPDPNRLVIPYGRLVNDLETQKPIGYIVFLVKEQGLYEIYKNTNLNKKYEMFLINEHGMMISGEDKTQIQTVRYPELTRRVLEGDLEGFFPDRVNNRDSYVSYRRIANTGWRIVGIISAAQYEEEVISLKNRILLIISTCFVLSALLSILWSHGISKPIRDLSRAMKDLETSRFNVRFEYPYRDEVGILSRSFNKMADRIHHLINTVYREQLLKQQTELKYLKFQVNPHFLFNTLDTIHWLAVIKGVPELGDITKRLGDIMREGVKGEDFVSVEREMQNIENYLAIQKYRFGRRLNVQIRMDPDVMQVVIPRFILQPIVENALIHGIEKKKGTGTVHISGSLRDGLAVFEVRDDGAGIPPDKLEGLRNVLRERTGGDLKEGVAGIGLTNVDQRIKLYYGSRYGLEIDSDAETGTKVTVVLPASSPPSTTGTQGS